MALIYDLDGYGLKMQVFDDHCVIKSKESVASYFIGKGFVGEKEIYFKDVTTVQYRNKANKYWLFKTKSLLFI